MKQLRIYSTSDGESRFEELGMLFSSVDSVTLAAPLGVTQPVGATQYVLVKVPNNWDGGMHPAPSCHVFQAGSNIDAIAQNVFDVDNDITDVNSNAQLDALILGPAVVSFRNCALNFNGGSHSVDDAGKFDQQAVAHCFDNAAAKFLYAWVDSFCSQRPKPRNRAFLIVANKPTVLDNIGNENGRHAALDVHAYPF